MASETLTPPQGVRAGAPTPAESAATPASAPSDAWNPAQYARFSAERAQPFHDLLALVRKQSGMRVIDLGCGSGELTQVLHRTVVARETVGIDRSASMLAVSERYAGDGVRFERADIAGLPASHSYDLVFSNAALHWLPDHGRLFRQLVGLLSVAGQLAIQVPANFDHATHLVAAEIARKSPFREALNGFVATRHVLGPVEYSELLEELGFREQHVRLQVYGHRLESRHAVVEWVKGTTLTPYKERLPEPLYLRFLQRYQERLFEQLADRRPFFYPFQRMLLWGMR